MKALILLVLTILLPGVACAKPACNFYVAASGGNDANNGLTAGAPFATLAHTQTVLQGVANNATSRVACLENGTYTLAADWAFTSSDTNETWMPIAGPSTINNPITVISGASNLYQITASAATNLTFYGLEFKNLGRSGAIDAMKLASATGYTVRWNYFTGCYGQCIGSGGTRNVSPFYDSNTFTASVRTTASSNFFDAAADGGDSLNGTFSHNLCTSFNGGCISIEAGPSDPTMAGNVFDRNILMNVMIGCADCGGLYMRNISATRTTDGNSMTNNFEFGTGAPGSGTGNEPGSQQCIYLDDGTSNTTVTGNICALNNAIGNLPLMNFYIHGGENNVLKFNIFQVQNTASYTDFFGDTGTQGSMLFQYVTSTPGSTPMTGNIIQNDIVYTAGAWPASGMDTCNGTCGAAPTFGGNDYFSGTGATISTWVWPNGGFTDSTTTQNVNPNFTNPSLNNFTVTTPPSGWVTIPGGQGPLPYFDP